MNTKQIDRVLRCHLKDFDAAETRYAWERRCAVHRTSSVNSDNYLLGVSSTNFSALYLFLIMTTVWPLVFLTLTILSSANWNTFDFIVRDCLYTDDWTIVTQRIGRLHDSKNNAHEQSRAAASVVKQWSASDSAAVHSKTMGPTAGVGPALY